MKFVDGFRWDNPHSPITANWVVRCSEHSTGYPPMEYLLPLDKFKCAALGGTCGRTIKAEVLRQELRSGA